MKSAFFRSHKCGINWLDRRNLPTQVASSSRLLRLVGLNPAER
jgi:hypothetical protein